MELKDYYQNNELICIETDLKQILKYTQSKMSSCWVQQEIPNTKYFQLAATSPSIKNGYRTIIVCLISDFNLAREQRCFNCSNVDGGLQWINFNYNYCRKKATDYKDDGSIFSIEYRQKNQHIVLKSGTCFNFKNKRKIT